MIASLDGIILDKSEKSMTIDVRGIGYLVFSPKESIASKKIGDKCFMHIRTIVREDNISLYGFNTHDELSFFDLLMTVTRVGPKLAMDIMSGSIHRVKKSIMAKEAVFLARIPGVGKKTAQRIILELHEKIKPDGMQEFDDGNNNNENAQHSEIIEALQKLGYQRSHISRVLHALPKEITNEEAVIKYFLNNA